jgi:hypothetical protein
MNLSDAILGGDEPLGGCIFSNLGLLANFYSAHELGDLECVTQFRNHLRALDLNARPGLPLHGNPRWPCIRLIPLDRLLLAMKVVKDPETGRIAHQPGTRDFARLHTRINKDRSYTWTGTELQMKVHRQRIAAANYAFCATHQESTGISSHTLQIRLRYFSYLAAMKTLNAGSLCSTLYQRGEERPSTESMTLIVCAETESSNIFSPFNLFIA